MTAADAIQANAQQRYEVRRADLPLSCPQPSMALWNSHPARLPADRGRRRDLPVSVLRRDPRPRRLKKCCLPGAQRGIYFSGDSNKQVIPRNGPGSG